MAMVTWSEKLSIGVATMDEQHKRLYQSMNDLMGAMSKGQSRTIMDPLLKSLVKYTKEHFAAEEAILTRWSYPGLAAHQALHASITKKVEDYVKRFEDGDLALSVSLAEFLNDWLTTHIQKEDRPYGNWLSGHGFH